MNGAVWIAAIVLFSISGPAALVTWRESAALAASAADDDAARYCRICQSHTMCRFPYDDPGEKCTEVESGDLEYSEIKWLVRRHNSLRQGIARARQTRSHRPPPARDMMQVFWDPELARIARRWALQCRLHEKDECRDVERFAVRQSVSALDLQEAGNRTTLERLDFHVVSWLDDDNDDDDDVNSYDRPLGLLGDETSAVSSSSSGLATPSVSNVGCGRATYSCCEYGGDSGGNDGSSSRSRVEALVCNYGPIETELEAAAVVPRRCETFSLLYSELCLKLQEEKEEEGGFSRQKSEDSYRDDVDDEEFPLRMHEDSRWWQNGGSSASVAGSLPSYPPSLLLGLLLLLLHNVLL